MKTCAVIVGGVVGIVLLVFVVFMLTPHAKVVVEPYDRVFDQLAYYSFKTFYIRPKMTQDQADLSTFQPYEKGVATWEGDYVWHFQSWYDLVSSPGGRARRVHFDGRLKSLAGDQWEEVTP